MKQAQPDRVSVVIAAFNAAETLPETLTSVLQQTHADVEIIVVDDGSTDGTADVAASVGGRIVVVRQPNQGPGAARNRGAREATGTWLAFLDADDIWLAEKLERQLEAAATTGADLIYTNVRPIGRVAGLGPAQHADGAMPEGDVFAWLLQDNFITLSSAMISQSAFLALDGFREVDSVKGTEDWDLWLRYAAAGGEVAAVDEILVEYRWSAGSLSADVLKMHRARCATLEQAICVGHDRLSAADVRRARAGAFACSAWYAARDGRPVTALRWTAQALWRGLSVRRAVSILSAGFRDR